MQRADGHTAPDRPHGDRTAFPDVRPHAHAQVDAHAAPDRHADAHRNDRERACGSADGNADPNGRRARHGRKWIAQRRRNDRDGESRCRACRPIGKISRAQAPAILQSALIKAGVNDPKVYWFTFDEGSREEALMIQYASPLRWQDGYAEMLRAAKQTLGRYYLQIDPPLYTAFVVATDLTGTSDTVQRLRRYAPEKLAKGEIGEEDFLNNYFEPEQVAISCAADGTCLGKMATPFPSFNFPFPFPPTPTP